MAKKQIRIYFLIPLLAALIFGGLNFTSFYKTGDNRIYDLYLHLKPPVEENDSILLLNVDDLAIAKVGMWPWSRSYMADGLVLMKEFGAKYAVFDIEYTEDSPLGVNSDFLNEEVPEAFANEFSTIKENISSLFNAIAQGNISLSDAQDYVEDLTGITEQSRQVLLEKVRNITRDNDLYLGQAARFFGNAYFTVNMLPEEDEDIPQDLKDWTYEHITLDDVQGESKIIEKAEDIRPAIQPIISRAQGAGFPNIIIDGDGVRRRVNLAIQYKDRYFPQLAYSALHHWLGNPRIQISEDRIQLEEAELPDGKVDDIAIPLDENGHVLINWPQKEFEQSFRHLSYYYLVLHKRQEERLVHNLEIMDEAGFLAYHQGDTNLLDAYNYAESLQQDILEGGEREQIREYREVRTFFFDELESFLSGDAETALQSELDRALASEDLPEDYREHYTQVKKDVTSTFKATGELFSSLQETRATLEKELQDSFCIIGWTGTATTDRGVNPFDETYDNVGTHASLINTVIQQRFLDVHPWWFGAIAGLITAFIVFFLIRNLNPVPSLLIGLGVIVLIIAGGVVYFILTGNYMPILTPLLSAVATFIVLTVFKFLSTAQERTFIRNAFGHYLSTDVINELLDNPDKLALGGNKKELTALFTDVKGFSTISETMDPTDLVRLLNTYLTEMSNTILDLRGTIDKYEGDAIISFFGAPVELEDHARRACLSAIRMKKVEKELNERVVAENLSPNPLFTRIGINTGEMVVGNMGTAQKMDYTIMGNAVNLAARLEGVNKQYGTWMLISEITYTTGGKEFATRKLDRVRVVGIQEPVRLYELIDEWSNVGEADRKAITAFHEGLSLFEDKQWDEAIEKFNQVLKLKPEDGPAQTYLKRCNDFKKKPPPENWDGVFNLSMK